MPRRFSESANFSGAATAVMTILTSAQTQGVRILSRYGNEHEKQDQTTEKNERCHLSPS